MPHKKFSVLSDTAHSVGRQGGHFIYACFSDRERQAVQQQRSLRKPKRLPRPGLSRESRTLSLTPPPLLCIPLRVQKSGDIHSCHECFPEFHFTMDGKGWQCRFSRRFDNEFLSKQLLRYKHPCNFMPSPLLKYPSGLLYAS